MKVILAVLIIFFGFVVALAGISGRKMYLDYRQKKGYFANGRTDGWNIGR